MHVPGGAHLAPRQPGTNQKTTGGATKKAERELMEAAVEKLEASYRGQMKERVEMIRDRAEGGLRGRQS